MKKIISAFLSAVVILSVCAITPSASAEEFSKTSFDFVQQMTIGLNLGNSFDGSVDRADETAWGNPKVTEQLIDAYKTAGFDTIRLPVTWNKAIDSNGDWKDGGVYFNRVKEVTDWIYNRGFYVILNTHHEMAWLNTWDAVKNSDESDFDQTKVDYMLNRYSNLWKNIATEFKDYGERLIFEGYNETRAAEGTWSSVEDDQVMLSQIGQTFIDAVRATGSNNEKRYLVLPTYAAGIGNQITNFIMPEDPANHIIIDVHSYDPHELCFREYSGTTFSQSDFDSKLNKSFENCYNTFTSKGIGVILGEFGAVNKENDEERVKYIDAVLKKCGQYGILPIWWDNGFKFPNSSVDAFALINRSNPYNVYFTTVLDKLINGAKEYKYDPDNQPSTTEPTTETTTKPTEPIEIPENGEVFFDWNGDLSFAKTDGWHSHASNLSDISGALTIDESGMVVDTTGYNFNSQLIQIEMALDTAQVETAIVAAKASDGKLYFEITSRGAKAGKYEGRDSAATPNFYDTKLKINKLYCFADGDWQNAINLCTEIIVERTSVIAIDVADLGDMIPDTIAINISGEWYEDALTYANFKISPIVAKSTNETLQGDVNGDGKLSIVDARQMLVAIANDSISDEMLEIADLNADGKITIFDARALLVKIANS